MSATTDASPALQDLAAAAAAAATAQQQLHQAVEAAVAGGASWRAIGQVLGVSGAVARRAHGPTPTAGERRPRRARVQLVHGWVMAGTPRGAGVAPVPAPRAPGSSSSPSRPGRTRTARLRVEAGRRVEQVLQAVVRVLARVARAVLLRLRR